MWSVYENKEVRCLLLTEKGDNEEVEYECFKLRANCVAISALCQHLYGICMKQKETCVALDVEDGRVYYVKIRYKEESAQPEYINDVLQCLSESLCEKLGLLEDNIDGKMGCFKKLGEKLRSLVPKINLSAGIPEAPSYKSSRTADIVDGVTECPEKEHALDNCMR